jgi:acyl-CoA dehydrogenase
MEFGLSQLQAALREVAGRFLAKHYPPERVAAIADSVTGYAADGWDPIVRLGWLDPGLGMVELALLAEESGYVLHPVPWWATVGLAVPGTAPRVPTTLAWCDDAAVPLAQAHRSTNCEAVPDPAGGWRVTGRKRLVPDLTAVAEVVLTAATDDGVALFRLPTGGPGAGWPPATGGPGAGGPQVAVRPCGSLDGLRRTGELTCTEAPARRLTTAAQTPAALRRLRWRALTLLAAEAVGVARRACRLAADHAGQRTQFGRPIGAYQGVGFRVADSYLVTELARSLAYRAAWLVGHPGRPATDPVEEAVASALVASRDAAVSACEHAIQVLGGIAMTWEHPIHRWYRRALWLQAFDAPSAAYREELAVRLLAEAGP